MAAMDLTTLARVKTAFEKTIVTDDPAISQIITEVSASAERYMNRHAKTEALVEIQDVEPGQRTFSLKGYGDPASVITSVKYDTERVFGGTTVDPSDYTLDTETGLLYLDIQPVTGRRVLKISYTGGMALTPTAFIAAFTDVANAVQQQVVHFWQQRGHLGLQNVSFDGGSLSMGADGSRWLSYVEDVLRLHKRFAYAA